MLPFFGHFISSAPAVKLSMFFYGNIENKNAHALKQNSANLDAPMELKASAKLDLQWWINNILQSGIQKSIYYRCIKTRVWSSARWLHHRLPLVPYEHRAVLFALQSFCDNVRNKQIRVMSGNSNTVFYTNNIGVASLGLVKTLQGWFGSLPWKEILSSAHHPGQQDILADRESKFFNDRTCCTKRFSGNYCSYGDLLRLICLLQD